MNLARLPLLHTTSCALWSYFFLDELHYFDASSNHLRFLLFIHTFPSTWIIVSLHMGVQADLPSPRADLCSFELTFPLVVALVQASMPCHAMVRACLRCSISSSRSNHSTKLVLGELFVRSLGSFNQTYIWPTWVRLGTQAWGFDIFYHSKMVFILDNTPLCKLLHQGPKTTRFIMTNL